jgi:7-cyano-7-deazaguanine synthase in queuosine biosynthesis
MMKLLRTLAAAFAALFLSAAPALAQAQWDNVSRVVAIGDLEGDYEKFTDMLRDCIALVQAATKQGQSLAQMKQQNVLAKYEELGKGFVKTADFIELIYKELSGEPKETSQADRTHH